MNEAILFFLSRVDENGDRFFYCGKGRKIKETKNFNQCRFYDRKSDAMLSLSKARRGWHSVNIGPLLDEYKVFSIKLHLDECEPY